MAEATNIAQLKAGNVTEKPKDFPAMLTAWLPEIKRALPRHMNGDRMSRIALTAFRRTPKLAQCNPLSVFAAVIQASQLGLEPDTLGRSYLIPYGNECQFVPGWKGLVDLANRSGMCTVWTGVIFSDQKFEFHDGSKRSLDVFGGTDLVDPDDITHAYAVGWVKGAEWPVIELWTVEKIRKHRDRYNKVGKRHYSFENWEMYARKIPLLQVLKYMPSSPELATAIALSDAAERGAQKIDLKDAIDGTWSPAPDDPKTGDADDDALKHGMERTASGADNTQPSSDDGPSDADLVAMIKRGEYDEARALAGPKAEMVEGMIKSHEASKQAPAQERPAARRQRGPINAE